MTDLPGHARVVIVGGGVVGASIAYHLAAAGCADVVLLERSAAGSGTTWHSAGNMEVYRPNPILGEMVRYGIDLYRRLEGLTGFSTGWTQSGRVMMATTRERMDAYRSVPGVGRRRGLDAYVMTPDEIVERLPVASKAGLLGGLWLPDDGRVSPTDLTNAYLRGARQLGTRVYEKMPAMRLVVGNGRIKGIETPQGIILCEHAVLAAGMWTPAIAASAGISVPLHAVEHQYLLTEADAAITKDMPMFLSYDERMYGREDGGGMLIGFFDRVAVPVSPEDLPGDFSFGLLQPNLDQVEAEIEIAVARFPMLAEAQIRTVINGPESFTPDGEMLLGETPEIENCHIAAGMNSSGVSLSAGIGRLMSERILDGRASLDTGFLDVARFGRREGRRSYARARASAVVSSLHTPEDPFQAEAPGRMLRCSPVHHALKGAGARFVAVNQWEVADHFGEAGEPPVQAVVREAIAAETGLSLSDLSSDCAFMLAGDGLDGFLHLLLGQDLPEGEAKRVALVNGRGGVDVTLIVFRLERGRLLCTSTAEQEGRLYGKVQRWSQAGGLAVEECGALYAAFEIGGTGSHRLLKEAGLSVSTEGGGAIGEIAGAPVLVLPSHLPGTALIRTRSDHAAGVWHAIRRAGEPLGLTLIGRRTRDHHRIGKGLPVFGREFRPGTALADSAYEGWVASRLAPRASWDEVYDLAAWRIENRDSAPLADLPIVLGDRVVGFVTSTSTVGTDCRLIGLVRADRLDGPLAVDTGQAMIEIPAGRASGQKRSSLMPGEESS